jgi:hypothetical protein
MGATWAHDKVLNTQYQTLSKRTTSEASRKSTKVAARFAAQWPKGMPIPFL